MQQFRLIKYSENMYLKTFPASSSQSTDASFMLSLLISFQGCLRSVSAVAHNLILVEVDGKCPFVGGGAYW